MGVEIGEADGDYIVLLECQECDERFESDKTMDNVCPHCLNWSGRFQSLDGYATNPELTWRD